MEWITVYEITGFALPMALLIGLILVFAGGGVFRRLWDRKSDAKSFSGWSVVKMGLCLFAVITGAVLISAEADRILDGSFNAGARAYRDGEYAMVEGTAADAKWSVSYFSFSIDDQNFFCEQYVRQRQKNDVETRFTEGKNLRVYYYDKGYIDEAEKQYEVVRIDVWDTAEENA